jgi:hypothetical protein
MNSKEENSPDLHMSQISEITSKNSAFGQDVGLGQRLTGLDNRPKQGLTRI